MSKSWVKRAVAPRLETNVGGLPPKVLGVMAMTTVLTFATLMTGYQVFFSQSVFA